MNTISQTPKNILPWVNQENIAVGFPVKTGISAADLAKLVPGTPVQLESDGEIDKAAAGNRPIGIVCSAYDGNDDTIRVLTGFVAIGNARVDASQDAGTQLVLDSVDVTNDRPHKFTEAGTSEWVVAVQLDESTDGDNSLVRVGYLASPVLTPAS